MIGKFEPVINAVIFAELVGAVITALVAFNVPLTAAQQQAVIGLAGVLGAVFFGAAVVARNNTYSPDSVEKLTGQVNPIVPSIPATPSVIQDVREN